MDYVATLRRLHANLQPRIYLEIGVMTGRTIALSGARTVGIDPKPQIPSRLLQANPQITLFAMTSDAFFARHTRETVLGDDRVDFGFIDGLHEFRQVLRGFHQR